MGCCCKTVVVVAALLAAFIGYKTHSALYDVPPLPDLPLDKWWGPGSPSSAVDKSIKPFKIEFKSDMLADLKYRLDHGNYYTEPLEGIGFEYGFNNKYLKEVVEFWKTKYNFKERESFLNTYPQFKTKIQGLDIHYLHIKPTETGKTRVQPLLLLHGWPGSVVEFYKIIPKLMAKQDGFVFELIIPSLPGYGFSQAAAKPGLGAAQVAVVMRNLMERLGYTRYMVHGGDWGAIIGSHMATLYPDHVYGHHTNMAVVQSGLSFIKLLLGSLYPRMLVEAEHESKIYPIGDKMQYILEESGYLHIQASKPDTVGVGLRDSPIGLAAYIMEKFSGWTNKHYKSLHDGGITKKFKLEEILDNIMIYWVSNSITTSQRLYSETLNKAQMSLKLDSIPITVPCSITRCGHEITYMSKCQLKDKYTNIVQLTDHENCGHFATMEEPELMAKDIISSVSKFDEFYKTKQQKNNEL